MSAYYNEIDPYAAQWLRNLIAAGHIAPGDVDERSIAHVHPEDLKGYTQAHFFAGIGGWSYAARLAGFSDDRPLWTGSCPCQPFSSAARGRGEGFKSDKHLWPHWRRLICAIKPPVIAGEQVAASGAWTDQVADDMEALGYTFWAVQLPAIAVGADHLRFRQWFIGHSDSHSEPRRSVDAKASWVPGCGGLSRGMGAANGVSVRVAQLRAYGNAIVPQVAAEVIGAYLDLEAA